MATALAKYWKNSIPAPQGAPYSTLAVSKETAVTPGATNDIRKIFKVPRNVTFGAGTFVQIGDMDTGAGLVFTLRITDDGVAFKKLIDASTAGQAGGLARPSKGPATEDAIGFTTDSNAWWVEILWATAAAGAQAADLIVGVELSGFYLTGAVPE